MHGTPYTHQMHLCLFPASGPPKFMAMGMLGPLLRTRRGNMFILIIMDRYANLMRVFSMTRTTATQVVTVFLHFWVIPYGIATYLFTDNPPEFLAKLFASVCIYL